MEPQKKTADIDPVQKSIPDRLVAFFLTSDHCKWPKMGSEMFLLISVWDRKNRFRQYHLTSSQMIATCAQTIANGFGIESFHFPVAKSGFGIEKLIEKHILGSKISLSLKSTFSIPNCPRALGGGETTDN